jgi:hypothetical protein
MNRLKIIDISFELIEQLLKDRGLVLKDFQLISSWIERQNYNMVSFKGTSSEYPETQEGNQILHEHPIY